MHKHIPGNNNNDKKESKSNSPNTNSATATATATVDNTNEMETNGAGSQDLFEGDLRLDEDTIVAAYGTEEERKRRDVTAHASKKWPFGVVYYNFHPSLSSAARSMIWQAMWEWRQKTCLRFVYSISASDYIEFTSADSGCYSNSIGRKGGRQVINLQDPGCVHKGIIVHEIGHAVGFWHEQSRPDRDAYVQVNWANIQDGKAHNFNKRTTSEVNSLGSGYDYQSIMHYGLTGFSNNGENTLDIRSPWTYVAQQLQTPGLTVGQRIGLSPRDTFQANKLYQCQTASADLVFYVAYASGLPDTDGLWNLPDPYVRLSVMDALGQWTTKQTSTRLGTTSPSWYQWMSFEDYASRGFVRASVRVWDDDGIWSADDPLTPAETLSLPQTVEQGWVSYLHAGKLRIYARLQAN